MIQLKKLIKSLDLQISPFESFKLCKKHLIQINRTCLLPECTHYFKSFCEQCIEHKHNNVNIRYLNTAISQGLVDQWSKVQQQYQTMKQIQRNADVNLGYCIDLFKNMRKDIFQEINFGVWEDMINKAIEVKKQVKTQEDFLRKIRQYSNKFNIKWEEEGKASSKHEGKNLIAEIQRNKSKLQGINDFAQKSLLLSQNISSEIKSSINQVRKNLQKSMNKVTKITSLTQPQQNNNNTDQLFLNLKNTSFNQTSKLESIISKFSQIKTLEIKTNKFHLKQQSWKCLIEYFPAMKFLKQLKLHLSGDLTQLPSIFESNKTKLRPIDKLYIKVSDQKVNIEHIYRIANSFQLSGLWITLTRCNLNYSNIYQLVEKTKIETTMTNLVLNDWHLILTVNTLTPKQKMMINQKFQDTSHKINKHSIQL